MCYIGVKGVKEKDKRKKKKDKLIDDILERKNYTDLKKAAEDMSISRKIKRDYHKPV